MGTIVEFINGVYGFKVCPDWLNEAYKRTVGYKCQTCGSMQNLEIHRIKRSNKGGLYTVLPLNHKKNNVKVLCKKCHKAVHYNEQGCRKR